MRDKIDRITRADLYLEIWNEPVTAVAMRLGVSDQAVRKACVAMSVPLPPRGYWARIAAGQHVSRPELPPPTPGEEVEYRVDRARQTRQGDDTPQPQGVEIVPVVVRPDVRNAHPLVKQYLEVARLRAKKVYSLPSPLTVDASSHSQDRGLRILDAIFRTLEGAGCQIFAAESYRDHPYAVVRGERIAFRMREKLTRTRHVLTTPEHQYHSLARTHDLVPNGLLELYVWHGPTPRYFVDRVWKETKTRSLQDSIKQICESFFAIAEKEIARRQVEAAEALRREERRKVHEQEQKVARKQAEAEARELARKTSLRANSKDWHEALMLRRYIAAVERAVRDRQVRSLSGLAVGEWLRWAHRVAAELDPLNAIRGDAL